MSLTREQHENRVRDRYQIAECGIHPRFAVVRHYTIMTRCFTRRGAERAMRRLITREIRKAWYVS